MLKIVSVLVFVSVGCMLGYLSLACATRLAICIGGRLGETVRNGNPDTMVIGAFWMAGLGLSSLLSIAFGCWAATGGNNYPDHAFYVMAGLVMFLLPFLATCGGMVFLAAHL